MSFRNTIKSIGHEFLYGAHLVALGSTGIILSVILIFGLQIDLIILIIPYLMFQIIYRYNHLREIQFDIKSNPERSSYIIKKKKYIIMVLVVYATLLSILLSTTNVLTILLVLYITLQGILYTEYFKKLPFYGAKNYHSSHFWALIILLVPLYYNIEINTFLYLVGFIFIRGIVNTVFFDLKDIEDDRQRGVKTFPVYLGKLRTLKVLQIINILSVLPLIIGIAIGNLPLYSLYLIFTVLLGIYYLTKAINMDDSRLRMTSYILIDGEYLLWPLVVWVGMYFI